jgi:hypothetical protein
MDNVYNTILSVVIFHLKPLYVSWGGYPLVLVSCTFSLAPKDPHAQRVAGVPVAVVHPPAILDGLHRDHVEQALKRQACRKFLCGVGLVVLLAQDAAELLTFAARPLLVAHVPLADHGLLGGLHRGEEMLGVDHAREVVRGHVLHDDLHGNGVVDVCEDLFGLVMFGYNVKLCDEMSSISSINTQTKRETIHTKPYRYENIQH